MIPGEEPTYDVVVSYAGADRPRAQILAGALRRRNLTVFADDDKAATWGEDLPDFLFDLYHRRARRCVMLVSASYTARQWTALERKAAQARELKEEGYILPVRLDEAELPQALAFVGFLSWPPEDEETIADLVMQKVTRRTARPAPAASLVVDDVIVSPHDDHVVLDVRIRNPGSEVVNVTRADFHVLSSDTQLVAYTPSATYPLAMEEEHNEVGVGHVLKPGEVDAFRLEVGCPSKCYGTAEIILQYNGDRQARSRQFEFRSWR